MGVAERCESEHRCEIDVGDHSRDGPRGGWDSCAAGSQLYNRQFSHKYMYSTFTVDGIYSLTIFSPCTTCVGYAAFIL